MPLSLNTRQRALLVATGKDQDRNVIPFGETVVWSSDQAGAIIEPQGMGETAWFHGPVGTYVITATSAGVSGSIGGEVIQAPMILTTIEVTVDHIEPLP